jgi:hypothetical protein
MPERGKLESLVVGWLSKRLISYNVFRAVPTTHLASYEVHPTLFATWGWLQKAICPR